MRILGVILGVFTLVEVNYPNLVPPGELAVFALVGIVTCFLVFPLRIDDRHSRVVDGGFVLLAAVCFLYVLVQTQPLTSALWIEGSSLGNRAGQETAVDFAVGILGLVVVLEATRRSIGWTLPLLSVVFLVYAWVGPWLPGWLMSHRGYPVGRIVSQTFLQSQGVFGVALRVMFTYVFLFVLLGALLQVTGATSFIVDFARRFFRGGAGGPAKVAVLSSGFMGSLSGSAVANTATTGTFTIPMMRSAGFRPHVAAGVEAAASSGGALVPPVMGAGAYMMLEIVRPPVTYLEIIRAAALPAVLYYTSLLLIVHFHARRLGETGRGDPSTSTDRPTRPQAPTEDDPGPEARGSWRRRLPEGMVFLGAFAGLLLFLALGYTAFRAVSLSLLVVVGVAAIHPRTRVGPGRLVDALAKASEDTVPLISAAACVGIIIGVVTLTGVGSRLPGLILPLAEDSLFLALVMIMVSAIILGMGLPSAICYLLLATLIGPALGDLGVVPLAAHLFIFYFGMMSMVTPPVALAAYAAASIANSSIMPTAVAAFRFALVGFTLPYMFVFRPELLMLDTAGATASVGQILPHLAIATLGIVCFAAGIGRFLFTPLGFAARVAMFAAAGLLLYPGRELLVPGFPLALHDAAGIAVFVAVVALTAGGKIRTVLSRARRA